MGLWQKLLEFSCVYKPQYQSNYISSKLLSVKPLHLVTFLESKICNSLTIYLFKFSMWHDWENKANRVENNMGLPRIEDFTLKKSWKAID